MNRLCIFITDQKSENIKHTTKYDKETFWTFWSKDKRVKGSRKRNFFRCKTFLKEKNGVEYKPSIFILENEIEKSLQ